MDNTMNIIPLSEMSDNQRGIISSLNGGIHFINRLQTLNIRVGKRIKRISASPFRGPVVIEISHSRIAIGHGMAKNILVEIEA